ncbi:MAG: hypothetical protein U0531_02915 [Dehalococcoidia bacterium]
MEALLLAGWVAPLALWTHQLNPPDGAPMVTFLGRTRAGALRFAVPAMLLCLLYAGAVRLTSRARGRTASVVAVAGAVLFALTLLPMFPGGTQDIFHNVADARLLWRHGVNPLQVPPSAYPDDPFFVHLFGYADLTSAYGPLWYLIAGLPAALAGDGLVANLVAQKALMAAFLLATVVIVGSAAGTSSLAPAQRDRTASGRRAGFAAAAVLVGWNPLLLWEFAGNGHNDIIMVFFAALAFIAAARGWWRSVFPLLALSALVKFTTLLLGPVLLVWLLRRPDAPRAKIVTGLALAAALTAVAYVPFWAGADTVTFLRRPGMSFILSPATLLHGALTAVMGGAEAARLTQELTGAAFAAAFGVTLLRLGRRTVTLTAAGFDALFGYLVFASWWWWPWYLSWLAPPAAWQAPRRRAWVFALFTTAALLTYCYWWQDPAEGTRAWFALYALIATGVFGLPLALWLSEARAARSRTGRES